MKEAIIKYIIINSPVAHFLLEQRATTKHNLSLADFDKLMDQVSRDKRISVSVKGDDVWYKARTIKPPRENPVEAFYRWQKENPYPREELGESPFKICFCAMWRTDDDEIFNEEKHEHRPDCDSLLFPEEYKKQNVRKRNPIKNSETSASQGDILLA